MSDDMCYGTTTIGKSWILEGYLGRQSRVRGQSYIMGVSTFTGALIWIVQWMNKWMTDRIGNQWCEWDTRRQLRHKIETQTLQQSWRGLFFCTA
jgi:hypothetical protein